MNKSSLKITYENYDSDRKYNGSYCYYLAEQSLKQKADEELEKQTEFERGKN